MSSRKITNSFSKGSKDQFLAALSGAGFTDEHLAHARKGGNLTVIKTLLDRSIALSKPFGTVTLGLYPTPEAYIAAIQAAGMKVGDWARDLMGQKAFTVSPIQRELQLVSVKVGDMGFAQNYNPTTQEILDWGKSQQSLGLCPSEVGPALRLQHQDQSAGEVLIVAMEPITDSGGDQRLFGVRRGGGGRWLYAYYDHPGFRWDHDYVWVFVRSQVA